MSKPRIVVSNVFYEVTSKGARGAAIFDTDDLKTFFLTQFTNTLKMFNYQCYGWSLLDDHYHLILKSSETSISKFMQRLNSVYAKHYNKVKNELGTVFYRRFASIIVQEETGLKDLIRYVHLNPVRANICTTDELDTYKWCGHQSLLNNKSDQIQNTGDVLKQFSATDSSKAYRNFIRENLTEQKSEKLILDIRNANLGMEKFSQPEPWILGAPKFVKETLERDCCKRARTARHLQENITCEKIHEKIEYFLHLPTNAIYRQGRLNDRTTARLMFAYIGSTQFDFTGVDLAKHLGVTSSAISKMLSQSKDVKNREELLNKILKEIKESHCITDAVISDSFVL